MIEFFRNLFASEFVPRGQAMYWHPDLVWLHAGADLVNAVAYYAILFSLFYFLLKRKDLSFKWMFVMFAVFFFASGAAHVMSIWTIWDPVYRFDGIVKLVAAFVSGLTAIAMWPLVNKALDLPSPQQLRLSNEQLQHEIDVRMSAEEKLERQSHILQSILDSMGDGVVVVDEKGRLLTSNPAAGHILGQERLERVEMLDQILNRQDADQAEVHLSGLNGEGGAWLSVTSRPVVDDAGSTFGTVCVMRDVTSRKITEETIKKREQQLAEAQQIARIGSWELDVENSRIEGSEEFYHVFGLERGTEPMTFESYLNLIHPDDRAVSRSIIEEASTNHQPFSFFHRIVRPDGAIRILQSRGHVVNEGSSGPVRVLGTDQDVTEAREAEEKLIRYAQQLEQSNRELEDFAYVASHDLQEPLRKIQSFGDRILKRHASTLDSEVVDYLRRMESSAQRMQVLVEDLLNYSRVTTNAQPFTEVNLNIVADQVLQDLERQLRDTGGEVEVALLPEIRADAPQMRQLLQNLVSNALKFQKPGVTPTVRVFAIVPPRSRRRHLEGEAAQRFQLCVEDNGIGFDEKYLDKIFAPFQRLHARGEYLGTGIGLAIARKIAGHHGGSITARSQPGEGSRFIVELPTSLLVSGE